MDRLFKERTVPLSSMNWLVKKLKEGEFFEEYKALDPQEPVTWWVWPSSDYGSATIIRAVASKTLSEWDGTRDESCAIAFTFAEMKGEDYPLFMKEKIWPITDLAKIAEMQADRDIQRMGKDLRNN